MQRSYIPLKQFLVIVVLLVVLLGVAIGFAVHYYRGYQSLAFAGGSGDQAKIIRLVKEVGELIELPQNETPTVATVKDPKVLKDQPFFAKAEEGDQVLLYTNAKTAILYRPGTHKLIEVGPITTGSSPAVNSSAGSTSKTKK
jgi:hypothetical protein